MKKTLSILVANHAGVLSRISGLFSRRGFNIDSLAVGVTDKPEISRITIVADGDEYTFEQLEKQLNKLIEVIKVKSFDANDILQRELLIDKVTVNADRRSEIMSIAEIMDAKIIDITLRTMTLQICDSAIHLARFEELIRPYGIIEMVRTGMIAIEKGTDALTLGKK